LRLISRRLIYHRRFETFFFIPRVRVREILHGFAKRRDFSVQMFLCISCNNG